MLHDTKQEDGTLLELHHPDYSLYVAALGNPVAKARRMLAADALRSNVICCPGARLCHDEPPLFFENTDYHVEMVFDRPRQVEEAVLVSPAFADNEGARISRGVYMKSRGVLSFFLNYGNDIGLSEIAVDYTLRGGGRQRMWLRVDVLSTKLDYHTHLRQMVADIEREYAMLSLSFLRKTYHTFENNPEAADTPDLIWWNIFKGVQGEFCRAVARVTDAPRNRLRVHTMHRRADQLRHVPPATANEWAEHQADALHLYSTEHWTLNDDTPENRFVKHALGTVAERYLRLKARIDARPGVPQGSRDEMERTAREMQRLMAAPLWRRVGRFTGLRGESLVLKQAAGYSTIFRLWALLQSTYDMREGTRHMELKPISELYEIWCFIMVKNLTLSLLAQQRGGVKQHVPGGSLTHDFIRQLRHGEPSKILIEQGGVRLAEVIYNAHLDTQGNGASGMGAEICSRTVAQRPDIVLRLTKEDAARGVEMTYLFDAKYRMDTDERGRDCPPEDTINQMHRYRAAIYYAQPDGQLRREVVGGYILFPGREGDGGQLPPSVVSVNIGALPLRPGQAHTTLATLLRGIISEPATQTLLHSIPQRGLRYEAEDKK